jgi:hypothetical protein
MRVLRASQRNANRGLCTSFRLNAAKISQRRPGAYTD